ESDPTYWSLEPGEDSSPIVDKLDSSGDPFSVGVTGPLVGTMLISPRCMGTVAILDEESIGSWTPSGIEHPVGSWTPSGDELPSAVLYVPMATGPVEPSGYALPRETNPNDLSQEILGAMTSGKAITTPISTPKGKGRLRIDGGALAFAVISEVPAAAPA